MIAYMDATAALTIRLSEAAAPKLEDAIPFREAIGHVSGRPKPWSEGLAKLLSGEIEFLFASQSSHRPVISRLTVSAAAIKAFVGADSASSGQDDIEITDSWSQCDALECMHGYENTLRPLKGLLFIGINPKLYKVTDVLALPSKASPQLMSPAERASTPDEHITFLNRPESLWSHLISGSALC